jgi:putative transposase
MPDWAHAPIHRFGEAGAYIVTGSTYQKLHHLKSKKRLNWFTHELLKRLGDNDINLQAWAVFSNHYHLVAHCEDGAILKNVLDRLHADTSYQVNQEDEVVGRKVWFQYWDTNITNSKSYFARLRYVHENPVKHKLVGEAIQYPWCSAGWFLKNATPATQRTLMTFPIDRVKVRDDFDPVLPDGFRL